MRARANVNPYVLADHVRTTLQTLGFVFRTHQGNSVLEFEVTSPCHMLVRVEDLTGIRSSLMFFTRVKVESALELLRTIGSTGSEEEVRKCADQVVKCLLDSLPTGPWTGLGFLRTREERRRWQNLAKM